MRSFISSFRPLLAAVAVIAGIEAAIALAIHPNPFERANYLDLAFGRAEPLNNLVVYDKLRRLLPLRADIIQVGDSSGLHGVRPDIVMRYLRGRRYVNLNCCVNTGFDGDYDIADLALRQMHGVSALVLYVNFNQLPNPRLANGQAVVGARRIHRAYAAPWSALNIPSEALRPSLTNAVYAINGLFEPTGPLADTPNAASDLMAAISRNLGWIPERDERMSGARLTEYWRTICGDSDTRYRDPVGDIAYFSRTQWLSGETQFLPLVTFERFARLAERHGAKLIIIFHPNPCAHLGEHMSERFRRALADLRRAHPGVAVYPEQPFDHWPREMFTTQSHLRIGFEGLTSRRVGRFVADALGIAPIAPDPLPDADQPPPAVDPGSTPLWTSSQPAVVWRARGVALERHAGGILRMTASSAPGRHLVETTIDGLVAGRSYIVSARFHGETPIRVAVQGVGDERRGVVECDPARETSRRYAEAYDGGLDERDGRLICWISITPSAGSALVSLEMLPSPRPPARNAQGRADVLIDAIELRNGSRLE